MSGHSRRSAPFSMTSSLLVGDVEFASRSKFRSFSALNKALKKHIELGRDWTDLKQTIKESCAKAPPFSQWRTIDMLDIYEGAKLPDKPGIYGFFNLRKAVEPKHRILYIGKSLKTLKTRVSKNHTKFVKSMRFGATNICYITTSNTNKAIRENTINMTEIFLIQEWGPYLNIQENPFNFEFESLEFDEYQMLTAFS